MNFADKKFKPDGKLNGAWERVFFPNGYGALVIRSRGSYKKRLWKLVVLRGSQDDNVICDDTPITNYVCDHLTEEEVTKLFHDIEKL